MIDSVSRFSLANSADDGGLMGSAKKNVEPTLGVLLAHSRPPIISAYFLEIASPKPVPP